MWATVEELEAQLGSQVRARRLAANRTVADLADAADIAAKTLQNLELGRGSSLATLVKVLRALDAEAWLGTLTPPAATSPVAILAAARRRAPRQRASRSRA